MAKLQAVALGGRVLALGLGVGACGGRGDATRSTNDGGLGPDAWLSQDAPGNDAFVADASVDVMDGGDGPRECAMSDDAPADVRVTDARIDVEYVDAGAVACLPPPSPSLCGALCGNGVLDTCRDGGLTPAGVSSAQEVCDSTDLGGNTCASLGFAAGTLACGSTCHDMLVLVGVPASRPETPIQQRDARASALS